MSVYEFGAFRLDVTQQSLTRKGQLVELQKKPFDVLALLVANSGKLISKDSLIRQIWSETAVEEGNLTVSIAKIRQVLGETKHQRQYIATLPRRGYRFVANVRIVEQPSTLVSVLPFEHNNSPRAEGLARVFVEDLVFHLSTVPNIRVVSKDRFLPDKGDEIALALASELSVVFAVAGRIIVYGEWFTVSAELVHFPLNQVLWRSRQSGEMSNLLLTQRYVEEQIRERLQSAISLDSQSPKRHARRAYDASDQLSLRGRYHLEKRSEEDLKISLECFRQAIKLKPQDPMPYVGLADSYNALGYHNILEPKVAFSRAKAAAAKALQLDFKVAEAHASLGYAKLFYEWDFAGAERCFETALHLNPDCVIAHHFYAYHLIVRGSVDMAIAELQNALRIDPLSLIVNASLGLCYYYVRRYDEAVEQFKATIKLNRYFELAHVWLALVYQQQRMWQEAFSEYKQASALAGSRGRILAGLGITYASSGNLRCAKIKLGELMNLAKKQFVSPYLFACFYTALGDIDRAFHYLGTAYDHRSDLLLGLKLDPLLDPLRLDARLFDLFRRFNWPYPG